jgi:hypothetical protein
MDEIMQFLKDAHDSSRWYHERSKDQQAFDSAVTADLERGKKIEVALKGAVGQMPAMNAFLTVKTMTELADYYERLHRLEQEIALADNVQQLAAQRGRNSQQ